MTALGYAVGLDYLVVGVEDDPGGLAIRVYVEARYDKRYYLVSDPDARSEIQRAWRSHHGFVTVPKRDLREVGVLLHDEASTRRDRP